MLLNNPRLRITVTLFATQSLFSAGTIAAFTLTPILGAQLGGGPRYAGLPATVLLLGRAAGAYPIGWLMDRAGRRPLLALGYLFGLVGMGLMALSVIWGTFTGLLAGSVLLGLSRATSEQARFVAAEVQPAARRAKAIGTVVFAGTLGAVGGPLLVDPAEQLALTSGLPGGAGPYLIAAVLMALAMLLAAVFLRPDPQQLGRQLADETAIATGQPEPRGRRPLAEIFSAGTVRLAVLAMIVGQLVMSLLMVIAPVHMQNHDHSTQAISWVIMAHTLGMFGLSGVTGWLIDRLGRVPMIVAGAATLIAACLIAPLSPAVSVVALALFLLGLGWNFCYVAGSSLLSDALTADERGQAQGANEAMVALAAGVGSAGTGVLFDIGGILAVSGLGIGMTAVLLAALAWRFRPGRLRQAAIHD